MALELTSSQQSSYLTPSSKVNFKCEEGIIACNNAVALLEQPNVLYHPMLRFLSNCSISTTLTRQPSATYVEYLKEFWYTAEVDEETKTITFSLSSVEEPLSFTQEKFMSTTGLPVCENVVPTPPPPKETVRAGLATLGIFDKDKPSLSSFVLVNSSPIKIKYFTPIWRLFMQYIVKCLVNVDDGVDKFLSETTVQPVTQPKAPTNLKLRKKKILPSSKPKSSYHVRVILPKKQVTETQHAEEPIDTADATKSLGASELVEEQVNQPKTAEAEKVQDQNVQEEIKESGLESMKDVTFDQIMDEIDQKNTDAKKAESPYDTESEIKIIKSFQTAIVSAVFKPEKPEYDSQITFLGAEPSHFEYDQTKSTNHGDFDSRLRSMPDDDPISLPGFETPNSADNDSQEGTAVTLHASVDMPAQSDPLGHLQEELRILNTKVDQLESSIFKKVTNNIQSSIPLLVVDTLKAHLLGLLSSSEKHSSSYD
ncbi:hypothetical protein Tco_0717185 [Tanacetum coccineum]